MAKSIEKYPIIDPGIYPGLWSGYSVKVEFGNDKFSQNIEVDEGVRGINCKCSIHVDDEGQLTIN